MAIKAISIKGIPAQNIFVNRAFPSIKNQSFSRNEKVTPRSFLQSRFHNNPALIYKKEEAKILGNQVLG